MVAVIPAQCDLHCEQKWKINNGRDMVPCEELFGSKKTSPQAVIEAGSRQWPKSITQLCCPFCCGKYLCSVFVVIVVVLMFRDRKPTRTSIGEKKNLLDHLWASGMVRSRGSNDIIRISFNSALFC